MGVGEIGTSTVKAVKNVVHGAMEGAMESGVEHKRYRNRGLKFS